MRDEALYRFTRRLYIFACVVSDLLFHVLWNTDEKWWKYWRDFRMNINRAVERALHKPPQTHTHMHTNIQNARFIAANIHTMYTFGISFFTVSMRRFLFIHSTDQQDFVCIFIRSQALYFFSFFLFYFIYLFYVNSFFHLAFSMGAMPFSWNLSVVDARTWPTANSKEREIFFSILLSHILFFFLFVSFCELKTSRFFLFGRWIHFW